MTTDARPAPAADQDEAPDLHTTAGKIADLDRRREEAVHAGSARSVERRYVALAQGSVRAGTLRSRLVRDRGDGRRGSTENPELGRDARLHANSVPTTVSSAG